jgi:hypothetical protein
LRSGLAEIGDLHRLGAAHDIELELVAGDDRLAVAAVHRMIGRRIEFDDPWIDDRGRLRRGGCAKGNDRNEDTGGSNTESRHSRHFCRMSPGRKFPMHIRGRIDWSR